MRSLKKRVPFVLVYLMLMFAVGTAAGESLPQSSYYNDISYYDARPDGRIVESAVYSEDTLTGEGEMEFFSSIVGLNEEDEYEYKYVYAYQIYNGDGSNVDIDAFSIFGIGDDAIADKDQIMTMEDTFNDPGQDATGRDAYHYDLKGDHSQVAWYFYGDSGVIGIGEHSQYLIIVSDHDLTFGIYDFIGIEDDVIVVPDEFSEEIETIPEPCTIALLGVGGLILRRTGRRSV